jgi:hypothetical protein
MTGAVLTAPPTTASAPVAAYRASTVLAVLGAVLLVGGTLLHPAGADPNDPVAAFAEYAAKGRVAWVAGHLVQLAGVAGFTLALLLLAGATAGASPSWARATRALGTASLALAATLQAVDGVALKAAVDLWSAAEAADRPALLAAALAVRQVEIGLAGLWSVVLGAAALGLGGVLLTAPRGSKIFGGLAVLAGATAIAGGLLVCVQGFSSAAMNVSLTGAALGSAALIGAAVRGWRPPDQRAPTAG